MIPVVLIGRNYYCYFSKIYSTTLYTPLAEQCLYDHGRYNQKSGKAEERTPHQKGSLDI